MKVYQETKGTCFVLQRVPPLVVTDLFEDIKDGVVLLALLEVLSGQKLVSLCAACDSTTDFKHFTSSDPSGLYFILSW